MQKQPTAKNQHHQLLLELKLAGSSLGDDADEEEQEAGTHNSRGGDDAKPTTTTSAVRERQQRRPTAVAVLQRLLETGQVTDQAVRRAHRELLKAYQKGTKAISCELGDSSSSLVVHPFAAVAAAPSTTSTTASCQPTTTTTATPTTRTRHIALRLYYDGAQYNGLAENVGVASDQSVERALFTALRRSQLSLAFISGDRDMAQYSRCGRTDRGVSAHGQIIALRLKSAIPVGAARDAEGTVPLSESDLPKNSFDTVTAWVPPRNRSKAATTRTNNPSNINPAESKSSNVAADVDFATAPIGDADACRTAAAADTIVVAPPRQQRTLSEYAYDRILNNLLPDDIRVLGWAPVSEDFSARFSATTRTYRYFFVPGSVLDIDRIRAGLDRMVGTHDFRNFCKMDVEKVYNFVRTIYSAQVCQQDDNVWFLEIHGQAFLWHQIRCMASLLFLIGRGLERPELVSDLLDVQKYPGKPSYPLAPERPLVLHECGFDERLHMGYSVPNLWSLTLRLSQQWEDLIMAAARLRSCLDSLGPQSVLVRDAMEFCSGKVQERQKKQQKYSRRNQQQQQQQQEQQRPQREDQPSIVSALTYKAPPFASDAVVSWKAALDWMTTSCGVRLDRVADAVHIPVLDRSMGTSYEQKVNSLTNPRRREKYEANVIRKRKSREEDAAFYAHMTQQGGSAV